MKSEEAKRLKELEVENARLKKLLAEAELDDAAGEWVRVRRGFPHIAHEHGVRSTANRAIRCGVTISGRLANSHLRYRAARLVARDCCQRRKLRSRIVQPPSQHGTERGRGESIARGG